VAAGLRPASAGTVALGPENAGIRVGLGERYLAVTTSENVARQALGVEPSRAVTALPEEIRAQAGESALFACLDPRRLIDDLRAAGVDRDAPVEILRGSALLSDRVRLVTLRSGREAGAISAELSIWYRDAGTNALAQTARLAADLLGRPSGPGP
jgi:hypothetical protein